MTVCRGVHNTVNAVNEIKLNKIVMALCQMEIQIFHEKAGFLKVCVVENITFLLTGTSLINNPFSIFVVIKIIKLLDTMNKIP